MEDPLTAINLEPKKKRGKPKARGNGRGTLYKLPDGRWRWQFRVGSVVQASGIAANTSLAETALAQA